MEQVISILSHYTNSDLEIQIGKPDSTRKFMLIGTDQNTVTIREWTITDNDQIHRCDHEYYAEEIIAMGNEFKPLFREWDKLIEPIEIEGESFVPLQRLNEIRGVSSKPEEYKFKTEEYEDSEDNKVYSCAWGFDQFRYFEFDTLTMSFGSSSSDDVSPQFQMMMELIKWGFDLFKYSKK